MHTNFGTEPRGAERSLSAQSAPAAFESTRPESTRHVRPPRGDGPAARVAVAGATGFAGQELLRLLARHQGVRVTAAMSSSTTASNRRLPALAHLWDGAIAPLSADTLAREADVVFLALPDSAAATLAPDLVEAGVRVIDLSGAFRLRDAVERARWY